MAERRGKEEKTPSAIRHFPAARASVPGSCAAQARRGCATESQKVQRLFPPRVGGRVASPGNASSWDSLVHGSRTGGRLSKNSSAGSSGAPAGEKRERKRRLEKKQKMSRDLRRRRSRRLNFFGFLLSAIVSTSPPFPRGHPERTEACFAWAVTYLFHASVLRAPRWSLVSYPRAARLPSQPCIEGDARVVPDPCPEPRRKHAGAESDACSLPILPAAGMGPGQQRVSSSSSFPRSSSSNWSLVLRPGSAPTRSIPSLSAVAMQPCRHSSRPFYSQR